MSSDTPSGHTDASEHSRDARTAVIIFNPIKVPREALAPRVDAAAEANGWGEVSWVETTVEDPGLGQAREAAEAGATMVVACGGDGTVRAVAEGLHGSRTALGIIPEGTGNLLARNLKLPLVQDEAIDVAFGGHTTEMDIATAEVTRADGSTETMDFVVAAGVGIDAQMVVNTDDTLKKHIGFLAYGLAILKALRGGNRLRVSFSIDGGKVRRTHVHTMMVGNCGELVGAIQLLPDAQANDGILDLVALRPHGPFGWAQIFTKILHQMYLKLRQRLQDKSYRVTGAKRDIHALRYDTGETMDIRLGKPEAFEVDGDVYGEVTAFRCTVDHLALTVREPVPPPVEEPGEPDVAAEADEGIEVHNPEADGPSDDPHPDDPNRGDTSDSEEGDNRSS